MLSTWDFKISLQLLFATNMHFTVQKTKYCFYKTEGDRVQKLGI